MKIIIKKNGEKFIQLKLDDILYNAAILGILKILKYSGDISSDDLPEKDSIDIPLKAFDDFAEKYINFLVNQYKKDFPYLYNFELSYKILLTENFENSENAKEKIKLLKNLALIAKSGTKKNSFNAKLDSPMWIFYHFMPDDSINIKKKTKRKEYSKKIGAILRKIYYSLQEILENKKQVEEKVNALFLENIQLIKNVYNYKNEFYMKAISSNIIKKVWDGRCWRSNYYRHILSKDIYEKIFILPLEKYIEKTSKRDLYCFTCGEEIKTIGLSSNYVWLNAYGIDSDKKNSVFWNGVRDDYMCAVCQLIYSAAPAGMSFIKNPYMKIFSSYFINQTNSIRLLYRMNQIFSNNLDSRLVDTYGKDLSPNLFIIWASIWDINMSEIEIIYDFIEILKIMNNDELNVDLLSSYHMKVFELSYKHLEKINQIKYKNNQENYIYIVDELLRLIVEGKKIQVFLIDLTINCIKNNRKGYFLKYIMEVMFIVNSIKTKERATMDEKSHRSIKWLGNKLGRLMRKKRLKSYMYEMIGYLNNGDQFKFVNTLIKTHVTYNCKIKYHYVDNLYNDEYDFESLGTVYIIGLAEVIDYEAIDNGRKELANEK